jgi:hypothetical protein
MHSLTNASDQQQVRTSDPEKRSVIDYEFEFSALRSPSVLAKSAEVVRIRIRVETVAYENRTKSAQSGGLERTGLTERISGLSRGRLVRRFVEETPRILGFFATSNLLREYSGRPDWRSETNCISNLL